jgi:hypothetical protein
MRELVEELLAFPLGRNDDIIDALAMQLELWRNTPMASAKKKDLSEGQFTVQSVLDGLDERKCLLELLFSYGRNDLYGLETSALFPWSK